MRLDGKLIVITGAKGGLGNFVTQAFLDAGASVAGVSRSIAVADFPHERFAAFPAELSGADAAADLIARVLSYSGRIDAAVHLIGGFEGGKRVDETSPAVVEKMFNLNFLSAFHLFAAVLPLMQAQRGGRILAIGSRAAAEPSPMSAAYAASKAALVSLVRSIAAENRRHGVQANIVLPGTMDTPANRAAMPEADFRAWVDPGQVARLLVFLAGGDASHVSGAVIPIFSGEV